MHFPLDTVCFVPGTGIIECVNCGLACGKFDRGCVVLNNFRVTFDLPTETVRICKRAAGRYTVHRHNYYHRITSLTIRNEGDLEQCEQLYRMNQYSQLWNGPYHRVPCKSISPCVRKKRDEEHIQVPIYKPVDMTKKTLDNAARSNILVIQQKHTDGVLDLSLSKKVIILSDEIIVSKCNKTPTQESRNETSIKCGSNEPQPSTSSLFEPSVPTSKALDSALLTKEFELLSSAKQTTAPSNRYLTRSKYSQSFRPVSYSDPDRRYSDKQIVKSLPRRNKKTKNTAKPMVKRTDVKKSAVFTGCNTTIQKKNFSKPLIVYVPPVNVEAYKENGNNLLSVTNAVGNALIRDNTGAGTSGSAAVLLPSSSSSRLSTSVLSVTVPIISNVDIVSAPHAGIDFGLRSNEVVAANTDIASTSTLRQSDTLNESKNAANLLLPLEFPVLTDEELYRLWHDGSADAHEAELYSYLNIDGPN